MGIRSLAMLITLALITCAVSAADSAKAMTNQDVISLVKAKVSENTISMAIRSAKSAFDTSAAGIVKLSVAGVPETIIQVMIEAKGGGDSAAGSAFAASSGKGMNPEEVVLMDGDKRSVMRYLVPSMRTAARVFGMGGMASYAALRGTQAELRLKNRQPAFIVAIPTNAQPDSYVTLASMAVRKNGTREVMIGGGYMSYSTGISKDRVIHVTSGKLPDQSTAPKGFILYRVNMDAPLVPGEYSFILYSSQVKVIGFFGGGGDSYFDFGVDA